MHNLRRTVYHPPQFHVEPAPTTDIALVCVARSTIAPLHEWGADRLRTVHDKACVGKRDKRTLSSGSGSSETRLEQRPPPMNRQRRRRPSLAEPLADVPDHVNAAIT